MLTNNIIVLDSYFILTNKSNLIDMLYAVIGFNTIFYYLVVAYFILGHPVCMYMYMYIYIYIYMYVCMYV